jgi:hypothetical protein
VMKKILAILVISCCGFAMHSSAQIDLKKFDLNNIDINDIIGKVMHVQHGFAPKFSLGDITIPKVQKVAEILGLKKDDEINRLFNTFRTGRTIYKVASYAGGAVLVYGIARKVDKAVTSNDYKTALVSGLTAIGSGLVVKFLTKSASYKAVDIFNGIAVKKIKDIFSIEPASETLGVGLYVKLD